MKNHFAHIKKTVRQKLETFVPDWKQRYFVLGISGGPDSVLLAHLFNALDLNFCLAHINYGLRGKESDGDEKFVRNLAKELNVKCFVHKAGLKKTKGQSVQMLARELRYTFFEKLLKEQKADLLVLAHHASDQVETVLLNFFRGCGIDGLTGMKTLSENKFRPLLDTTKEEILAALEEKQIGFRIDSSNLKSDYKRNFLRNEVLPQLEKKWPGLEGTILENIQRFNSVASALRQIPTPAFDFQKNFQLDLLQLKSDPVQLNLFRQTAVKAGFRLTDLEKLLNNPNNASKKLEAPCGLLEKRSHQLNFIARATENEKPQLVIKGNRVSVRIPGKNIFRSFNEEINAASIKGQFELRSWQPGDKMIPLGMKGFKKISDLLTDLKLPVSAKKKVQVLCDAEKIVWLVGFRIDERVKLNGRETRAGRVFLSVD